MAAKKELCERSGGSVGKRRRPLVATLNQCDSTLDDHDTSTTKHEPGAEAARVGFLVHTVLSVRRYGGKEEVNGLWPPFP